MGKSVNFDLYIAAALTGILSAQTKRPNAKWVCREAVRIGIRTALAAHEHPALLNKIRRPR